MARPCVSFVFLVVAAMSAGTADTKLEWKFKEGETFYVELETKSKQSFGFGAQPVRSEKTKTAVTRYKVLKTGPEGTVLEMQFVGMKSDGKDLGAALGDAMSKFMKDVAFRVTMDNAGRVTKFEGIEEFAKKMVGTDPKALEAFRASGVEDTFSQVVVQTLGFLPSKAVAKGDRWKLDGKLPIPLIGTFKVTNEFEYQGPGDMGHVIGSIQQISYEIPKEQIGTLFRIKKADLMAEPSKGRIIFDAETGRLVRREQMTKFSFTATVEVQGKDQTMTMENEGTEVMRLLKDNPLK